ncbi:MAG TPA: hypothetical protein VFS40_15625 [Gemmatimonadales bacterium]|nr:hypothetical protein [Gemmatimonadales bacterium]
MPTPLRRLRPAGARTLVLLLALCLTGWGPVPLAAQSPAPANQGLLGQLSQLFIFGEGADPLFLGGSGDPNNPINIQVHGAHFIPAAVAGNASLISFLGNSISSSVSEVPVSAASGSSTFRFEGGTPVRTSTSAGPILAERAQTLGRGRVVVAAGRTQVNFTTLRGVPLEDIRLTFTHQNVNFPGCDSVAGGDCALLGVPLVENETIDLALDLHVDLSLTTFLLAYGLTDRVDVAVVVPIAHTALRGASLAQIQPFGAGPAVHFFAGTPQNPVLTANRAVDASATGLGDVAARVKINLRDATPVALGLLLEGRFPTGSEQDLLGSGGFVGRGLAILSARFGDFSPHANLGYLYRGKFRDSDAFLATAGFDHLLAPWATLAADLISAFQVGTSHLTVPGDVVIQAPFRRTVHTSDIPNARDDLVDASLGLKLTTPQGITIVTNGAWPLNRGGLRPNVAWNVGVEYNF